MAKLKNGLGGSISGKIGNLVGIELKGENYLKSKPNRKAPATERELINRFLFEMVQNWVQPLKEVAAVDYKNFCPTYEGIQALFSQVYREALTKEGFDSYIDPQKVQISNGNLKLSDGILMVYSEVEKALSFSWNPISGIQMGARDRVILVAYNVEKEFVRADLCGPPRYEGGATLSFKAAPKGSYYIYTAFVSEDRSLQSNSLYLGEIAVE